MLLTEKLTVKYHPQQISDFIGLDNVKPVLLSYIASPQPQVFLFEGPSGTGKTSMAFALAKALGVHEGMIARTHALRCNLEWVKKISSDCDFHPTLGNWWFYLIDEAEEMTRPAQIDLLNILDPPPPRGIFVFTANLPEKVVKVVQGENGEKKEKVETIDKLETRFRSRCCQLLFSSFNLRQDIAKRLAYIWDQEAPPGTPPPNFELIAKDSRNNIRDAYNELEQRLLRL